MSREGFECVGNRARYCVSTESDDTMNEDTPIGVASTVKEGVTPTMVDMIVENEKISSLEDTTVLESFPTLSTPIILRRYCPVRSSYANITGKPIGEEVESYGFFLGKKVAYPVVANYVARVMIKLRVDVELKDNIVMAMPKITLEGHYTCAGEKKTMKKPSQTFRGVSVSNSNSFDVLNSVDNDEEFGTNGGTTNLVNNEATSSGSSFMNADNDGEFASNTPIVPTGIVESDSEVEVVFDETANLRISTSGKDGSDKGYGTNSLLEQWRDSYPDNDDYDPYDDDMYENHDLSEHLQSICDDLDITPWLEGEEKGRIDLVKDHKKSLRHEEGFKEVLWSILDMVLQGLMRKLSFLHLPTSSISALVTSAANPWKLLPKLRCRDFLAKLLVSEASVHDLWS
ncbi:hypothetical protein Tco_1281993 [Tanacetum coccineum]